MIGPPQAIKFHSGVIRNDILQNIVFYGTSPGWICQPLLNRRQIQQVGKWRRQKRLPQQPFAGISPVFRQKSAYLSTGAFGYQFVSFQKIKLSANQMPKRLAACGSFLHLQDAAVHVLCSCSRLNLAIDGINAVTVEDKCLSARRIKRYLSD